MADGIAPAIDKVGAPEPTAPEAQAGAPTLDTTAAPGPTSAPAGIANGSEEKPEGSKIPEGAGPAVGAPKPVEVMSVPETPVNDRTPAGGTPRPELKIDEEPKLPPKEEEAVVITGVQEPAPTPTTSKPGDDANGTAMTGALPTEPVEEIIAGVPPGEKRKLDDAAAPATTATNGDTATDSSEGSDEPAEKKAKTDESPDELQDTNGKSSKPKKERKAVPSAGKTARKTRSQGPVEV